MRIINGYRVYDREELKCTSNYTWYTKDTNEVVAMGQKYHGGYRTMKELHSDKEAMEKIWKEIKKEEMIEYYKSETLGWIIYIFIMIFGNIFKDFFPWGMIYATIYFAKWRKDFHGTNYKG